MNLNRFCHEFAVELVVLLLALLCVARVHAQVTDKPITKLPDLSAVTMDHNIEQKRGCAAWWAQGDDKFGDWHLERAFCRGDGCYKVGTNLAKMAVARTENVWQIDINQLTKGTTRLPEPDSVAACMGRLAPRPPSSWVVDRPTSADGTRPVYCLKADGTREAKACDRVSDTIKGNGVDAGKSAPRWCYCQTRSKEAGGPYCRYADDNPKRSLRDPIVRVALCKQQN